MKIGIIGTGRIANRFVPETKEVKGITVVGVYNPHLDSAKKFAEKWNIRSYNEITDLFQTVDSVYVASPHETHYAYAKKALENGKHVLVEKPIGFVKNQIEELYSYAENNKLIIMEGIKTAYCPGFQKVLEIVKSGKIGEIRNVEACFTKLEKTTNRELRDIVYGGSFTELGSYCTLPIIKILGEEYSNIQFESIKNEFGIDVFTKVYFRYPNALATATCGLGVKSEGNMIISGTKGYVIVRAPWWKTSEFEIHYEDSNKTERYDEQFLGDGLRYELKAMRELINQQNVNEWFTQKESCAISKIFEEFMKVMGRV